MKPARPTKRIEPVGRAASPGAKILAAIEEATEILQEEGLESSRLTVRSYELAAPAKGYQPDDVKRVRESLGESQTVFASFLGVNVNTIRSWEQGKRRPQPIANRFLSEIEGDVPYWRKRVAAMSRKLGRPISSGG